MNVDYYKWIQDPANPNIYRVFNNFQGILVPLVEIRFLPDGETVDKNGNPGTFSTWSILILGGVAFDALGVKEIANIENITIDDIKTRALELYKKVLTRLLDDCNKSLNN
jgi:hypothetical protein